MIQATKFVVSPVWRIILKDLGGNEDDVLFHAKLPPDLFKRKQAYLSTEEYFRLWRALEISLEDPLFPLKIGQRASAETFTPPVFASLCCPDFNIAMERLSRYKQLIGPLVLDVQKTKSATKVRLDCLYPEHPLPESLIAMEMVFLVHLFRMGTRKHIYPRKLSCTSNGLINKTYSEFLGIQPEKGPLNEIQFFRKDAELPFITANDKMQQLLESDLNLQLENVDKEKAISHRVQRTLLTLLPSGRGTADAVAGELAVSRRTLQRLLSNEGTNFRNELNNTRKHLAFQYLENSNLPD